MINVTGRSLADDEKGAVLDSAARHGLTCGGAEIPLEGADREAAALFAALPPPGPPGDPEVVVAFATKLVELAARDLVVLDDRVNPLLFVFLGAAAAENPDRGLHAAAVLSRNETGEPVVSLLPV